MHCSASAYQEISQVATCNVCSIVLQEVHKYFGYEDDFMISKVLSLMRLNAPISYRHRLLKSHLIRSHHCLWSHEKDLSSPIKLRYTAHNEFKRNQGCSAASSCASEHLLGELALTECFLRLPSSSMASSTIPRFLTIILVFITDGNQDWWHKAPLASLEQNAIPTSSTAQLVVGCSRPTCPLTLRASFSSRSILDTNRKEKSLLARSSQGD